MYIGAVTPLSKTSPQNPPSPRASGHAAGGRGAARAPASSRMPIVASTDFMRRRERQPRGSRARARLNPATKSTMAATHAAIPSDCTPRSASLAPNRPSMLCVGWAEAVFQLGSSA